MLECIFGKNPLGNILGGFQLLCRILCKHIEDVAQVERFRPLKHKVEVMVVP